MYPLFFFFSPPLLLQADAMEFSGHDLLCHLRVDTKAVGREVGQFDSDTTLCAILADGLTSTSDGSTVSVMRAEMTLFFFQQPVGNICVSAIYFFSIWCLFVLWE